MKNEDRLNLFEQALSRLQTGENLESVLSSMVADKELIEMIRTVSLIQLPEEQMPVAGQRAQQNSKQAFLQAALSIKSSPHKSGFWGWLHGLRLVSQLALAAIILVFSLTITGIGSAQALPGQPLYSVKRLVEQTQLALTRDSLGRLQLEEVLDARRVNELLRLQKSERWQPVQFAGWMHQNSDGSWQVQGIPVLLDEQSPIWNPMLNGSYVEVKGLLGQAGVVVRQIELRLFKLQGTLQLIEPGNWHVNGIPLKITPQTQTQVKLSQGLLVDVTAIRLNNDQYLALVINIASHKPVQNSALQNTNSPLVSATVTENAFPNATTKPTASIKPMSTDYSEDDQVSNSKTSVQSQKSTDDDQETVQNTNEPDLPDETDEPDDHEKTKEPDDD